MGCDIHLHVEVKIKDKWHHYDRPDIGRNNFLFNLMAGVRGEGKPEKPISLPKGLPRDISELTAFEADYCKEDWHNHSYLTSKEVVTLFEKLKENNPPFDFRSNLQWGYLFGNGYESFYKYPEDYPKELQDFRFVFWFDN